MTPPDTAFEPPGFGDARNVADGVFWIRLALPFRLNHVNVWALDDGDGWTLIDTGIDDAATRAAWDAVLTGPLGTKPVTRVVATHFHPDHIGLAHWLVERNGAEFVTALTEWLYALAIGRNGEDDHRQAERFYRSAGIAGGMLTEVVVRSTAYRRAVPRVPLSLRRLRRGESLNIGGAAWRMIGGAGHTPEPVALHRADTPVLVAGDQVLPRISPNISVWPGEPDADPLTDFFDDFDPYAALPADTLVLPSHGRPFVGLHARLEELRRHHDERLADTLEHCREPATAATVSERLFPAGLDAQQTVFAVGEAIAHLNHLIRRGLVERSADAGGVHLYRSVR